ncbi:MAG: apolipoprotein N-acyltransferase [Chlamydiae bacterium]|nr:apolipoprotein N-acyltransferase [Chlamydiota bacterium]
MNNFFPLLQIFFSLVIVAFGHPSFHYWLAPAAAAVGYAIFWRVILFFPSKKTRFFSAAIWYAMVQAIQLSWMTAIEYQGIYILFIYVFLSVWLGLQFGLVSLLLQPLKKLSIPRILAIASAWTIIEWTRQFILCGFSLNFSGLSLSSFLYPLQMATLFGALGLSFWVILVNLLGLKAFLEKKGKNYGVWIVAAIFPYFFGFLHIYYHSKNKIETPAISALIVQTGLMPSQKSPLPGHLGKFISPYQQWERILSLLKGSQTKMADLIILPESVVPFTSSKGIYSESKVREIFQNIFQAETKEIFPPLYPPYAEIGKVSNAFWAQALANLFNAEVVLGLDYTDESVKKNYNSAFHLFPGGAKLNRYDKRILLPLAEYLPFNWLSPLVKLYGINEFFSHGKETTVFSGKIPFTVSICYEETFPRLIREGRKKGAEVLINLSNDAWYPKSNLAKTHFDHARLRAVENGASLVRACNTGITAVVDSLGRIAAQLEETDPLGEPFSGVLKTNIDPYSYQTLYLLWGDLGIISLSFLFLLPFIALRKYFSW